MPTSLCSCVVETRQGAGHAVAARLAALPGVEVHAGADQDKLVVTIEDAGEDAGDGGAHGAADLLGAINQVAGVVNTILVYHYGGDDLGPYPVQAPAAPIAAERVATDAPSS